MGRPLISIGDLPDEDRRVFFQIRDKLNTASKKKLREYGRAIAKARAREKETQESLLYGINSIIEKKYKKPIGSLVKKGSWRSQIVRLEKGDLHSGDVRVMLVLLITKVLKNVSCFEELLGIPIQPLTKPNISSFIDGIWSKYYSRMDSDSGFLPRPPLRNEILADGLVALSADWKSEENLSCVLSELRTLLGENTDWLRRCLLYNIIPCWCDSSPGELTSVKVLDSLKLFYDRESVSGSRSWILQCLRKHCELHSCWVSLDDCRTFLQSELRNCDDDIVWFIAFVLAQLVGMSRDSDIEKEQLLIADLASVSRVGIGEDELQNREWERVENGIRAPHHSWFYLAETDAILNMNVKGLEDSSVRRRAEELWMIVLFRMASFRNSRNRSTLDDVICWMTEKRTDLADFCKKQESTWPRRPFRGVMK